MRTIAIVISIFILPMLCSAEDTASLRDLATKRGMYIGAAANIRFQRDPVYAETLAREYNMLTPENDLKFHRTQPEKGQYRFDHGDAYIDFANQHDMQVRGHALIWHRSTPEWVRDATWTRDGLIDVMREHIQAVAGHYQGKLFSWDVVNEYFEEDGSMRKSVWSETIGADYMDLAHQYAREADPTAKLIVNDYGIANINKKSDALYAWVKGALQRGVPVDGVGFQMHVRADWKFGADEFARNMQRFADLGLEIHITEMDVRIEEPVTPEKLEQQANLYGNILRACLNQPSCKVFVMWGVTDRMSWVPWTFRGFNDALIFDRDFKPKPAYMQIKNTLMKDFHD